MKRVFVVLIVVVGLIGGALTLLLVARPKAPQRDYIAEYDTLIAQRFPDGGAGVRDLEALLALDRYAPIQAIATACVERAIERAAAEGLRIDLIDVSPLVHVVLNPGEEPVRWPDDPEQRATAERALREARAEAIRRVLELLMDPAWRSAAAAFGAHDTVVMPISQAPSLYDRALIHLLPTSQSARADAVLIRLSGDEEARLEALRSMLGLARSAASNPSVLAGFTQAAIEILAHGTVVELIAGRGEPIEDPGAWLAEFQRHAALRPDVSWHIAGERLAVLDILEAEYTRRPGAMRFNTPATLPVVGISHGSMYAILDGYHDAMAEAVALKPGERGDAVSRATDALLSVDIRARRLIEEIVPAFDGMLVQFDRADAVRIAAIKALALAAYRADHGAWPGTLEQLVPTYLETVPMDPFSPGAAEPLVYRVEADGTVWLYSRGFDLTDNGGVRPSDARDRGPGNDLVFLPRGD